MFSLDDVMAGVSLSVVNVVAELEDESLVSFLVEKLLLVDVVLTLEVLVGVVVCGADVIVDAESFVVDLVLGVVNGPVCFVGTKLLVTFEVLVEIADFSVDVILDVDELFVGFVLEVEDEPVCFVVIGLVVSVEVPVTSEVLACVEVSLVEAMVGLDFPIVE